MGSCLCLYCCGGIGREIADLVRSIDSYHPRWEQVVFVDDRISGCQVDGIDVYCLDEVVARFGRDRLEFVVTTGEPVVRETLYDRLVRNGLRLASITYPGFELSPSSSLGIGTIVHRGAIVTCGVHIGKGCLINKHAVIGHDVTIGKHCVISTNATVSGNVAIHDRCYVGSGAVIREGVKVGADSIVGIGSVVLHDVEPRSVVVGNPARLLRVNSAGRVFGSNA